VNARVHSKQASPAQFKLVPAVTIVTVVVAVAVGLIVRIWLSFHSPINSDEAVVGLMALAASHGHFTAFYWGQSYGGTAEVDLTALLFLAVGPTAFAARLVVALLSLAAAVLTWRIVCRLVSSRAIAVIAGALVWVAPFATVNLSVLFYGFRGTTLACGLGTLLCSLRILDGHQRCADFAFVGILLGVGWWSSPEVVYYAIPSGLILIGALWPSAVNRTRVWVLGTVSGIAAFGVGSAPWLWANVNSHFASIEIARFKSGHSHSSFGKRLSEFFGPVLPTELGLRRPDNLGWVTEGLGKMVTQSLYVGLVTLIIGSLIFCLIRPGRTMAIGVGVICFPFVYAVSPATSVFANGRYGLFLPPLLIMMIAVGSSEIAQRVTFLPSTPSPSGRISRDQKAHGVASRKGILLMSCITGASLVLCVVGFVQTAHLPYAFTDSWGQPDDSSLTAVSLLERSGITTGYADYWVAYKLDFLSQRQLTITTIGSDANRSQSIRVAVLSSRQPAWLFAPLDAAQSRASGTQLSAPRLAIGPGGISQADFIATLKRLGVGYTIVHTSLLNAVVPDEKVTPAQALSPRSEEKH
jgi:hypothetical protein